MWKEVETIILGSFAKKRNRFVVKYRQVHGVKEGL